MAGFSANEEDVTSSVWPSGAAFATRSAPMIPLAPGRLSTTNVWPMRAVNSCARMRAVVSGPPAPKPTMMRTGREG